MQQEQVGASPARQALHRGGQQGEAKNSGLGTTGSSVA
jgi:hypothetical protein